MGDADDPNSQASITINATGGTISTEKGEAHGIYGKQRGTGAINITSAAEITTKGILAHGIFGGHEGTGAVDITSTAKITTKGRYARGIQSRIGSSPSTAAMNINSEAAINTEGGRAHGISATHAGSTGTINITSAADITATGLGSDGLEAAGSGNQRFRVKVTGGTILGGRSTGAGINTASRGGGTIDIQSGSTLSALSDRAIIDADGAAAITNTGTIIGFVTLGGGDDTFTNSSSNSFNVRSFADTDGDRIRDKESVAVNDFGTGSDTFTNTATGTVRLLTVEDMSGLSSEVDDDTAPTDWDTTFVKEYFSAGSARLSITGGATAGNSGGGIFRADGGELRIDTVLDDGVVDTTDVLVVDRTEVGSGGPTKVIVANAGGAGGLTGRGKTDGILVIEVLDAGYSASSAFVLGAPAVAGAYEYDLVQADNQNWYLQSLKKSAGLQAQLYGYSALQVVLREEIDTLWQRGRRGQLLDMDGTASQSGSGLWMRSRYLKTSVDAGVTFGADSANTSLDYRQSMIQLGYDHELLAGADGYLAAGVFGHYKRLDLDVDNAMGERLSSADTSGYGGGASLIWYSQDGFYGGLVGQLTAYDIDVTGYTGGKGSLDALTWSISVEGGHRFDFIGGTRLVPQAQLAWHGLELDDFTDSRGVVVTWEEKKALTGRLGLALEGGRLKSQGGNGLTGYVLTNLVHDFDRPGSLNASGTSVGMQVNKMRVNRTRIEGRFGVQLLTDDDRLIFFGEIGVAKDLRGKPHTQYSGTAGLRWNF
ncbi:autotransporter outer membrane beta-barrel domain-containing protein [Candidatus Vondammii sp. HM_W22]|uniref:autotransporter outer membrane beta-barrel domain-containing protein n=1 Tax=Candidatus Vondammii sp. HM_W22 TaxID=2687299 RepID=UPI001F138DDD|nr:autotransporter outer membrane beta-barrel domain-containing protein [Candidatus Vondammii sp. HM_W22]